MSSVTGGRVRPIWKSILQLDRWHPSQHPQNASNAAYAKTLNLNYNYSTDIRSLNLSGSGSYSQQTFAVPVGVGFMFRVGTRADFMVGTTLHYTLPTI